MVKQSEESLTRRTANGVIGQAFRQYGASRRQSDSFDLDITSDAPSPKLN